MCRHFFIFNVNQFCRLILAGCLRVLNFDTEDGGSIFLRNIGNYCQTTRYHIAEDSTRHSHLYENLKSIIYYYYYYFKLQMCFYLVAVYYNKTQHAINTQHKITHHTQTNTAHKTTQTITDTLHTMDTMQIQLQIYIYIYICIYIYVVHFRIPATQNKFECWECKKLQLKGQEDVVP
jgi:hypothetical protein